MKRKLVLIAALASSSFLQTTLAKDPPPSHRPDPLPAGVVVPTPTGGAAGGVTIKGTTVIGRYEPLPGGSHVNVNVNTPSGTQVGVTTQTVNGQTTYLGGSVGWSFR